MKIGIRQRCIPHRVVLVAAVVNGVPVGMLANSFTSVSLDPPLVSVNFARTSSTWPILTQAKQWGISVLAAGQANEFLPQSFGALRRG